MRHRRSDLTYVERQLRAYRPPWWRRLWWAFLSR
jgi:hypothetical protein